MQSICLYSFNTVQCLINYRKLNAHYVFICAQRAMGVVIAGTEDKITKKKLKQQNYCTFYIFSFRFVSLHNNFVFFVCVCCIIIFYKRIKVVFGAF